MDQFNTHDPSTPLLFRHFADGLLRVAIMRSKNNLQQGLKAYEDIIREHILQMMKGKKVPKPIIHDEALFTAKMMTVMSSQGGVRLLEIVQALKSATTNTRSYMSDSRFLTLDEIRRFLSVELFHF